MCPRAGASTNLPDQRVSVSLHYIDLLKSWHVPTKLSLENDKNIKPTLLKLMVFGHTGRWARHAADTLASCLDGEIEQKNQTKAKQNKTNKQKKKKKKKQMEEGVEGRGEGGGEGGGG